MIICRKKRLKNFLKINCTDSNLTLQIYIYKYKFYDLPYCFCDIRINILIVFNKDTSTFFFLKDCMLVKKNKGVDLHLTMKQNDHSVSG